VESEGVFGLDSVTVPCATCVTERNWLNESQRPREDETRCRLAVSLDTWRYRHALVIRRQDDRREDKS
jgi:endogenous inhibitor of DNA gyrase (YacG/DUF329 family)